MNVRRAGTGDLPALEELYRAFFAESPPREHDHADVEQELAETREIVAAELAFLAEEDGAAIGFALVRRRNPSLAELTDLFVRPELAPPASRRRSCAKPCQPSTAASTSSTSRPRQGMRSHAPCTSAGASVTTSSG